MKPHLNTTLLFLLLTVGFAGGVSGQDVPDEGLYLVCKNPDHPEWILIQIDSETDRAGFRRVLYPLENYEEVMDWDSEMQDIKAKTSDDNVGFYTAHYQGEFIILNWTRGYIERTLNTKGRNNLLIDRQTGNISMEADRDFAVCTKRERNAFLAENERHNQAIRGRIRERAF